MAPDTGYRFFSKIVHNDAMKQDPHEIYGWRAFFLALSVNGSPLMNLQNG